MPFTSLEFILFFSALLPIFFMTPHRSRWLLLLAGSCFFYSRVGVKPLLLLLLSTVADYMIARLIWQSENQPRRKIYLFVSIFLNIGALFFFKYISYFHTIDAHFHWNITHIALPVGISFYTFTKLGYVIDVYRKKTVPENHLGYFAEFVTFFPNLASGPIERANHLLPQLKKGIVFDDQRVTEGFRRVLWGGFKKVVIADRLAIYVNSVYDQPQNFAGQALLLATLLLAFQIYADFSAYTDIALGIAKILGVSLVENFRQPYFATSILDFWRRWHISLTSWIREYLFFPLSRFLLRKSHNRLSTQYIQAFSYLVMMCAVGLWHGASWTFLFWGALHGLYMVVDMRLPARFRLPPRTTLQALLRIGITFLLVSFAWIFFRANSLANAKYIIAHLFSISGSPISGITAPIALDPGVVAITDTLGLTGISTGSILLIQVGLSLVWVLVLLLVDLLDANRGFLQSIERSPALVRWSFYYGVTGTMLLLGTWGTQEFIYFHF